MGLHASRRLAAIALGIGALVLALYTLLVTDSAVLALEQNKKVQQSGSRCIPILTCILPFVPYQPDRQER